MTRVRRLGAFLEVLDEEGCRHLLRIASVQLVSDTDPFRNETLISAAGRTIRVAQALDEIVALMLERGPTAGGVAA